MPEQKTLPMSLRSYKSEMTYQLAKKDGRTIPLELEPALQIWDHWRLVQNRFPYDNAFKIHHMLLPKRAGIRERWDLNEEEKAEFEKLLKEFVYPNYNTWFENCPSRRSVPSIYHIHLGVYLEERPNG